MARVTGVGGFFFRSQDPAALNAWYAEHLGVIETESKSYDDAGWFQDRGEAVLMAFPADTPGFFGADDKTWKLNFRVDDLDGMVGQLTAAGIEVAVDPVDYPNGRFADLQDPEGNGIQLWEPNAASVARDPGPPED